MLALPSVESAGSSAVVPALLRLQLHLTTQAAARVHHPSPRDLPAGELLCGAATTWVAVSFATVITLAQLVVEKDC